MILPIVGYGNSVLRKETEEIQENDITIQGLISDMYETMYKAKGIGLAAPQVGKTLRLFIVDATSFAEDKEKNDEEIEQLKKFKRVFINPIILKEKGEEWRFEEGCLSLPSIRESIYRKSEITIEYYDENWNLKTETYNSIIARIIQHEYDHIEGVLFIDYLSALKRSFLTKKLNSIKDGTVDVNYKMKFLKQKR